MLPALRRAFSPPALAPPPAPAPPYLSRPPAASARPSPSRCHAPLTTARRCSYPVSQRESTRRRVAASVTPSQPPPEAASPRIRPSAPEPAIEARQASDAALDAAAPSRGAAASWAAPLAGVEVVGADGARVALTGLWATRRVVVAWTRHFGCLLCRKRATMLANEKVSESLPSPRSTPKWANSPDNIFHLIRDDLAMPSVASPICDSNF
ncbi:hypothetical protein CLOM_g9834 [Closterium sp. NIES-68]|nr:hypothetical protein CLOM_g9834 [Closterium sp. NIES-68]